MPTRWPWRSKDEQESDREEVERVVDRVQRLREDMNRLFDRAEHDIEKGMQGG
jgi:hypothetical protein